MSDEFDDLEFDDGLFADPETLARAEAEAVRGSSRATQRGGAGAGSKPGGPRPTHAIAQPAVPRQWSGGRAGPPPAAGAAPDTKLAPLPYVDRHVHLPGDVDTDNEPDPPEIAIDAQGRYAVVPAPIARGAPPAAGGTSRFGQDLAPRRALARSTSMNDPQTGSQVLAAPTQGGTKTGGAALGGAASSRPTHRGSQSTSGMPAPSAAATGAGLGAGAGAGVGPPAPFAPRAFARAPSVASLARRAAMEQAMGLPPSQAVRDAGPPRSQPNGERDTERERSVEVAAWSAIRASQEIKSEAGHEGGALAVPPPPPAAAGPSRAMPRGRAYDPDEAERLRREMSELAAARKAAEDDIKAKQQLIYALRGEAKLVRLNAAESTKAHLEREQAMQKQLADLQETLAREKAAARRQLESMQTEHIFKTHTLATSAQKARIAPGTSARPGASQAVRGTPSRRPGQPAGGVLATPSKSPTGRRGPKANGLGQDGAALGAADFATPLVLRKAARLKEHTTPAAASPGFKGLRNTFHGARIDSAIIPSRKRAKLDGADGTMETPVRAATQHGLPSSPMHGGINDQDAWVGDEDGRSTQQDDVDMNDEDEEDVFGETRDERDVRSEIVSAAFQHVSLSAASAMPGDEQYQQRDLVPTIQKVLHLRITDDERDSAVKYEHACTRLLAHLSSPSSPALQLCLDLLGDLYDILDIIGNRTTTDNMMLELDTACAVIDMLVDVQQRLAVWQEAIELFQFRVPVSYPLVSLALRFDPHVADPAFGQLAARAEPGNDKDPSMSVQYGLCTARLVGCIALNDDGLLEGIEGYVVHESGMPKLLAREQPFEVVHEAIDAVFMLATHASMFRALLHSENTDNGMGRSPLLDPLCRHLLEEHPSKQDLQTTTTLRLKIVAILSVIASRHRDAVVILGRAYCLVPTLVKLMERQSEAIWGLSESAEGIQSSFALLVAVVSLLHYLVFPPKMQIDSKAASQNEVLAGVDLLSKLRLSFPSATRGSLHAAKDFNGLHHSFIVAIGRISYAELTEAELGGGWTADDIRAVQYLAQDLLESVVEGPEADSIYELYVAPCEGSATKPGNAGGVGGEAIDLDEADDAAWAVEAAQAADDVIVVD